MTDGDNLAARASKPEPASASRAAGDAWAHEDWPEYDLIGGVIFEPPLTREERRRRGVGLGPSALALLGK